MKLLYSFIAFIFIFCTVSPSFSQEEPIKLSSKTIESLNKTPNIAFGVRTEHELRSAIGTFERLKNSTMDMNNFEIVMSGQVLIDIAKGKALSQLIESQFKDSRFHISVCSVAMERLDLTLSDLPKGIKMTPTYTIRLLELQALGYNTIY